MKIALLGYGKMGKAIEKIACERGHEITAIQDPNTTKGTLENADVAINFSVPDAAVENIKSALDISIPVICGTTGWLDRKDEVIAYCHRKEAAFLYASNFSVGVNLFFALNQKLATLMQNHPNYSVSLEEIHHIHKLDAPSGTALSLVEDIIEASTYQSWTLGEHTKQRLQIPIHSIREGEVPGTHSVTYQNTVDSIRIQHQAFNRNGFALGAVIAAEWIVGKKGVFSMTDVLNL
ncbi:MAG: 4-hydroxy-tetrahydrodipicolinate reductase [Flavobacteriaceae bacterium]